MLHGVEVAQHRLQLGDGEAGMNDVHLPHDLGVRHLLVCGCASGEDVLSGGGEPTLRNEHGQPMQLGSTRGLTVAEADWSGFVADWSRREPLSAVTLAPTSIGRLSDGKRTTWSVAARSMTRLLIRLRSSRDADPGPVIDPKVTVAMTPPPRSA